MIDRLSLYTLPIVVSALLHGILIWAIIHVWQDAITPPDFKRPEFVKATLVELKTKAPEQKLAKAPMQKVDLTADKKQDTSVEKKRQEDAAKKAKELQATKEKQVQEANIKAAKEKAIKEQQVKDKAAKEAADKEKAQRAKADTEKRAKEEARKRQQEAMDKALREEEMMLAEQAEAETVNSFKAIIMERIAQKWSRPPSARRGMVCELVVQLVPTGKIVTVNVVKSSGNDAFDRSAEQAVRAVDIIPELKEMEIATFERNFRTINLLFNPEDLRL